ncbi:MAG: dienelactone hydrolase family protein [Hyphomonadaceae bacterium]|nr:dienelactone hydrolase family protein [Hyphomonadaceae bacterium]
MSDVAPETLDLRIAQLAPHFTVTKPPGAGLFPVLFMLHGCGGPRPFLREMTKVALAAGAAVVVIDSFAPRRISRVAAFATVCTGMRLRGRERAGDLYAALAWARTQSWADVARFAAIGWSHGSWTIMDALALRAGAEIERATGLSGLPAEPLDGLAATLLVYPYAGPGSLTGQRDWRIQPASTAIIAGRDYIVGDTRGALQRQRARGAPIEILVFEAVTHAFEDREAEDPRVRYNESATRREHDLLQAMIAGLR